MKIGFNRAIVFGLVAAAPWIVRAQEKAPLTNQLNKLSYSLGMNIGMNLKQSGFEVDVDLMAAAIKDVLAGRELKLTEAQARDVFAEQQKEMRAKREETRLKLAEKNREEGEKFMIANSSKPGVQSYQAKLADGTPYEMQYKILSEGDGPNAKNTDTATFNIRGTLINGTEFDSSARRGSPMKYVVGRLPIRGLSEGLTLMNPGSKYILYVPSKLAYGDHAGPGIEPGSTLIFEVELLETEASVETSATPLTSDIVRVPSKEDLDRGEKIQVIKAEDAARMAKSNAVAPPKK